MTEPYHLPAHQRARAPFGLHHLRANVRPPHSLAADADGDELQLARVAAAFRHFLEALGLDLSDPNLAGTDHRVA
ncbi:MAG: hypothetical protein ACT4PM_05660, partial [Gemmatimonadales bacterium]